MNKLEQQYRQELENLKVLEVAWNGITKMFDKIHENETTQGESDSNRV